MFLKSIVIFVIICLIIMFIYYKLNMMYDINTFEFNNLIKEDNMVFDDKYESVFDDKYE